MADEQTTGNAKDIPPAANQRAFSRRQLFTAALPFGAAVISGGYYATKVEPFWPRFHEFPIRISGLPASFNNYRIAHVTDLHIGHTSYSYLQRAMARIESLKPDLVLVTGDVVHHTSAWIDAAADLLKTFTSPVMVSFGNHDYGQYRGDQEEYDLDLSEKLARALSAAGCPVLRNEARAIQHADGRLWIVGLDDLWFGEFRPEAAFEKVPVQQPGNSVIVMSHNPDTAELLDAHRPDLILSGHTHGGQIRAPFYGALRLNIAQTQYDMGHFQLPNSQLYVSTGVGYILSLRFNCRPEVPIYRLQRA